MIAASLECHRVCSCSHGVSLMTLHGWMIHANIFACMQGWRVGPKQVQCICQPAWLEMANSSVSTGLGWRCIFASAHAGAIKHTQIHIRWLWKGIVVSSSEAMHPFHKKWGHGSFFFYFVLLRSYCAKCHAILVSGSEIRFLHCPANQTSKLPAGV